MNGLNFGDWVWAWDNDVRGKVKRFYIGYYGGWYYTIANGKTPDNEFMICRWKHVAPYTQEIDWNKVPVNTKVLVSDDYKNWESGYFAVFMPNSPTKYGVFALCQEPTEQYSATHIKQYAFIKLHPDVEVKEE